jgi:chromosome segregation ATPase
MVSTQNTPTAIEKESLEAHVELCAQRYDTMKENMERMDARLTSVETMIKEIKSMLAEKENQAYRKLLSIGFTIIGSLSTIVIGLALYLVKMPH